MKVECTVYRCRDASGVLLYIGCSPDPMGRVSEHRRYKPWGSAISTVTVEFYSGKALALIAEANAIRTELPLWNVHHKPSPVHSVGIFDDSFDASRQSTWAGDPNAKLIAHIEAYAAASGLPPSTVTSRAVGDGGLYRRIKSGKKCSLDMSERITTFMSAAHTAA